MSGDLTEGAERRHSGGVDAGRLRNRIAFRPIGRTPVEPTARRSSGLTVRNLTPRPTLWLIWRPQNVSSLVRSQVARRGHRPRGNVPCLLQRITVARSAEATTSLLMSLCCGPLTRDIGAQWVFSGIDPALESAGDT